MPLSNNTEWYLDAIIYEVYVRGFNDANGDGSGDIPGLTAKLDYLAWLGIDCIWLLPIFDSPLRDGGYDVRDFNEILPAFGTVDDFRDLIEKAHERGIRVISDLVLNHTSDQHPWFQRARKAPADSPERNWYVWSADPQKYAGARIIFSDAEKSNWTWDEEAGAFYWHRFFHHQPDLNFENPDVQEAMLDVAAYWMELGIDGFRVDAVPYLFEREGTDCAGLPETHEFCKRLRKFVDERFPGRVLLAEANLWPEDLVDYFGDGDEFHMSFHFPIMPRLFMALQSEDREPIVEILERTPTLPSGCQWAMFLRNHDELTLEMVTDAERDYLYDAYARDPKMRCNSGIRRRLAPLMDNGRRRIELLHALLLSLPGTPVLYYGDEIGMGDNIYLGDRDGVRTPMQWSGDRNGGFSSADYEKIYFPLIMDPVYGYQSVNVEAQMRHGSSLLNWIRRLVRLRRTTPVFGRGAYEPLHPENPAVYAFTRSVEGDTVLCLNNLSRFTQPVDIDLGQYIGRRPVEMMGGVRFPEIDADPYRLAVGPHGFLWLRLEAH